MSGPPQELLMGAAAARLGNAAAAGTQVHGLSVAVVVQDLEPETFIRCAIDFAMAVPDAEAVAWQRAFTRTVFLAGRPESLARRHPASLTEPGGALAWYGPARREELRNLSRMLPAFHGSAAAVPPPGPVLVPVPGTPTGGMVTAVVATQDVNTTDYLVHTHHLVAEATLRGLISPGDTLRVEHRDELDGQLVRTALQPAATLRVQTRIAHDTRRTDRLRLYGLLVADNRGEQLCDPNVP